MYHFQVKKWHTCN